MFVEDYDTVHLERLFFNHPHLITSRVIVQDLSRGSILRIETTEKATCFIEVSEPEYRRGGISMCGFPRQWPQPGYGGRVILPAVIVVGEKIRYTCADHDVRAHTSDVIGIALLQ